MGKRDDPVVTENQDALSGIVATLARKGLIDQMPGSADQRQRMLRITDTGIKPAAPY
jgi:DNA-binding MarR family transcriptional regulator